MVTVHDSETGDLLGAIAEEDLQFLIQSLDTDLYFDADTIGMLEADGASPSLVAFLRKSLGAREGMEISWGRH